MLLNLWTNANNTAQTTQITAFCVVAARAAQPVLVAVLGTPGSFDSEIPLCLIQVDLCLLINGSVTGVGLLRLPLLLLKIQGLRQQLVLFLLSKYEAIRGLIDELLLFQCAARLGAGISWVWRKGFDFVVIFKLRLGL